MSNPSSTTPQESVPPPDEGETVEAPVQGHGGTTAAANTGVVDQGATSDAALTSWTQAHLHPHATIQHNGLVIVYVGLPEGQIMVNGIIMDIVPTEFWLSNTSEHPSIAPPDSPPPHPSAACENVEMSLSNAYRRAEIRELFNPRVTFGLRYRQVQLPRFRDGPEPEIGSREWCERIVAEGDPLRMARAIARAREIVRNKKKPSKSSSSAKDSSSTMAPPLPPEPMSSRGDELVSDSPQPTTAPDKGKGKEAVPSEPLSNLDYKGKGKAVHEDPAPSSDYKGKGKAVNYEEPRDVGCAQDIQMGGVHDHLSHAAAGPSKSPAPMTLTGDAFAQLFPPGSFDQQVYMAQDSDRTPPPPPTPSSARPLAPPPRPSVESSPIQLSMPPLADVQNGEYFRRHGAPQVSVQGRYFAPSNYSSMHGLDPIEWLDAMSIMNPIPEEDVSYGNGGSGSSTAHTYTPAPTASSEAGSSQPTEVPEHGDAEMQLDGPNGTGPHASRSEGTPTEDRRVSDVDDRGEDGDFLTGYNNMSTESAAASREESPMSARPSHPLRQVQTHMYGDDASQDVPTSQPMVREQPAHVHLSPSTRMRRQHPVLTTASAPPPLQHGAQHDAQVVVNGFPPPPRSAQGRLSNGVVEQRPEPSQTNGGSVDYSQ